jgi:hypothetical protein
VLAVADHSHHLEVKPGLAAKISAKKHGLQDAPEDARSDEVLHDVGVVSGNRVSRSCRFSASKIAVATSRGVAVLVSSVATP